MKFTAGFIIVAFFVAFSSQSTPFKNCKDGTAPEDLRVSNCSKSPCSFIRGKNVTAEWDFSVPEETTFLKPRVRATILGATVSYPFPQKDACSTLKDAKCPLNKGEKVTYELKMPILKSYPKIPLIVEFAFLDDRDKIVVCFALSAKVSDK